jgi:hypothetical protein
VVIIWGRYALVGALRERTDEAGMKKVLFGDAGAMFGCPDGTRALWSDAMENLGTQVRCSWLA